MSEWMQWLAFILAFVYLGLVAAWTWPVVAIVLGIVLTTSVLLFLIDR